jgi:hypothetical protein
MRRLLLFPLVVAAAVALAPTNAWAGSPHFVYVSATRSGDTLVGPPMTIRFSNITVTDQTSGISTKLSGSY